MARGVMFALSFVFLSALLVILSILFFHTALSSEERATEFSLYHRLYDLDSSLHAIIRTLYSTSNDYSFGVHNRSLSIGQTFPLNNVSALNTSLTALQQFVEADDAAIRFSLDTFQNRPFRILPYAVNYTNTDSQTITIHPTTLNYNQYTFHISPIQQPLGTVTWNAFSSGSFPLTIITGNSTNQQTSTQLVDLAEDVDVRIQGIPSGELRIQINNQIVTLTTSIPVPLLVNTTIRFFGKEQPHLFSPTLYAISFPTFNLLKTSDVPLTP